MQNPRAFLWLGTLLAVLTVGWWAWGADTFPDRAVAPASAPVVAQLASFRALSLGLNIPVDSALHAAAQRFAEQVAQRSQGRLRVTVYPEQQLGSDEQMLELARAGQLDLVLVPTAKFSAALPAMQYADLPFFLASREELYEMIDGAPGQALLAKLPAIDLVGLTFWENGFKHFTANRPLRRPEDFAGLRMRTMKSPMIAAQFTRMGALPIPIDFHATYRALAEGAVDGQENPLVAIVGMRFHEVQKHLTLSSHGWLGYVFAASRRVVESLPPDDWRMLQEVAREITPWEREETARREGAFIERVRAAGVQVHVLSPEERLRFQQLLAPVADQFGRAVGYDLLGNTAEARQHARDAAAGAGSAPTWLLALDADLSGPTAISGGALYRGLQMAVEDLNRQGGLLGRRVEMVARDNAGVPAKGLDNLRHFDSHDNLLAVVGGQQGAVVGHSVAALGQVQRPYVVAMASAADALAHPEGARWAFRVSMSDRQLLPAMLERALRAGPPIVLLAERSARGRAGEALLRERLRQLPKGSVRWVWVDAGDPGLGAQVRALLAEGTRVMVLGIEGRDVRTVVRAVAASPAAQRPLLLSHRSAINSGLLEAPAEELSQVEFQFVQSVLLNQGPGADRRQAFWQRYRKRYTLDAAAASPALDFTMQAYDAAQLIASAVQQAGGNDPEAVRRALERLPPHAGLLRDYAPAFSPASHEALTDQPVRFGRLNEQGRVVAAD